MLEFLEYIVYANFVCEFDFCQKSRMVVQSMHSWFQSECRYNHWVPLPYTTKSSATAEVAHDADVEAHSLRL